jgi:dTMP kinase
MTGDLVDAAAKRSAYRELLRNRNYRLWFSATFVSSLGDWMGFVALQALVASLFAPGSRPALFALGGVMMARLAPSLLFGPIAGVLADRYDRRLLIVFADVARFGLFIAIAFSRDLVALFALTFVVECLAMMFVAAKDASLPAVVERRQLGEANQLNLLVTYGTLPLGAFAATVILPIEALLSRFGIQADPTRVALVVDAFTYLVSAALMYRLRLPRQAHPVSGRGESPGFVAELRQGIEFIRQYPLIRALITGIAGVAFGMGMVVALGPEFVRAELGQQPEAWFTLITSVGIGLVGGLGASVEIGKRFSKERVFPLCLAATGAITAVIALMESFVAVLMFAALLGFAGGLGFVQAYTLLHERTEDETRARTFAALYIGARSALFASLGLGPFLAGTIGTVGIFIAGRMATFPAIRVTILAGALVALFFGVASIRGMYRSRRALPDHTVRLAPEPAPRDRGLFVVFEGVEGSGKSTQVRALVDALESEGHNALATREPGGPPVAERLRALLLEPNADAMDDRTEALLLAAARAEHVDKVIRPELEAGTIVVCDRYIDSSLAYQGRARGLGEASIAEINRWAVGGLEPDVVVLLDLDPAEGLRRARGRAEWDRLEGEGLAFHNQVAEAYRALAKANPDRYVVVDASADVETVARDVRDGIVGWLPVPKAEAEAATGLTDRRA